MRSAGGRYGRIDFNRLSAGVRTRLKLSQQIYSLCYSVLFFLNIVKQECMGLACARMVSVFYNFLNVLINLISYNLIYCIYFPTHSLLNFKIRI
jgi:hypothetical protein